MIIGVLLRCAGDCRKLLFPDLRFRLTQTDVSSSSQLEKTRHSRLTTGQTGTGSEAKNDFRQWRDGTMINTSFLFYANLSTLTSLGWTGDPLLMVVDYLTLYLTPVIIVVGIIGNTLSLSVFSFTHLQRLSSSLYLSTLSVADIVFLLALLVIWLERVNCTLFSRDGWCQGVQYATKVSGFLAPWNVVSFTGERYITVYHPLHKDKLCTKQKARIVVLLLSIFSLAFYTYSVWTYGVVTFEHTKPFCAPLPDHQNLITVMNGLGTVFSCLAPSVLIVALNVRIIRKIHHYQSQTYDVPTMSIAAAAATDALRRRSIVQTSVSASGSMHIKFASTTHKVQSHRLTVLPIPASYPTIAPPAGALQLVPPSSADRVKRLVRGRTQYRTARMLLILSSVTVLLNLPTHVFVVHSLVEELIWDVGLGPQVQGKLKWQELFQLVYFLNFAVNFFIYSACGRQFRTGLARLCARLRINAHKWGHAIYYGACHKNVARHERKTGGYNA